MDALTCEGCTDRGTRGCGTGECVETSSFDQKKAFAVAVLPFKNALEVVLVVALGKLQVTKEAEKTM